MSALYLGIDLGTSGIRCAVVDGGRRVVAMTRGSYPDDSATGWWRAVAEGLDALRSAIGDGAMLRIAAAAVNGTSGSMVLVDAGLEPLSAPLMYDTSGHETEARAIAAHAPPGHITRGGSSALARALALLARDRAGAARHLCHQADFILARLRGKGGISDENNCLKTGFDPATRSWPDWAARAGMRTSLLPDVRPAGAAIGPICAAMAARFGLSPALRMHAGTTDSIAAFLATGAAAPGQAVTSLGTTLAIKMISLLRIDDPARGIYSHRLGGHWLVGGASNTGGGALLAQFTLDQITALSARIDPSRLLNLGLYPLSKKGERFPVNDPDLMPVLTPRPADDALFLQALLEGIAAIEARCYAAMADLGAPRPAMIFTAGGGGQSAVWTAIRRQIVCPNIVDAPQTEAAVGSAYLAMTG